MYDVVIIGAGVSGSACARELSKYNLSICVVEKEEDVCCGTSKANSAIVHSGIDCKTGTLMAQMNIRGNEMMDELSKQLDFEFRRNGSLILCFSEDGVEFLFNTEVKEIQKEQAGYILITQNGEIHARCVVNAAGVYADVFHNMVSENKIHITPRRGEYELLDRAAGGIVDKTIFQLPGKYGKGVLVTPTVHGNILIGPTADDHDDKDGTNTTRAGLAHVTTSGTRSVPSLPMRQVITSFAGNRAHEDGHEFIIEELKDAPFFVDCAGIESPGLSSAPAIGERVAAIVERLFKPSKNADFIETRKGILNPKKLSEDEYKELIKEKPEYGNIICRCEMITEGEIMDAVNRPLGAKSLDGVKRRTRAGMGRCQAGFCSPRTMEIIARERGISQLDITKSGGKSKIVVGMSKNRG